MFTFDGSDSTLKLYVDRGEDTNITRNYDDPIATIHNSTASVTIGYDLNSGDPVNYFHGTIDDVRIYNRVLSTGEIWQLYQEGL